MPRLALAKEGAMIEVRIRCSRCGEDLMDEAHPMDGHPGIRVQGETGGEKGTIWLSSLYGSYNVDAEVEAPENSVTRFSCPLCGESLESTRTCEICGAAMVSFRLDGGGVIQICSRRGCKRHLIEFTDVRTELRPFFDQHAHRL